MKTLCWLGSSKKDLRTLAKAIRADFGWALDEVAKGGTPESAKVLKGFGAADVLELVEDDAAGTYRAIYTVRFAEILYVLHVFQKKSKSGIATSKQDIDLIKQRLRAAEADYANRGAGK
jgi:phage-related protein